MANVRATGVRRGSGSDVSPCIRLIGIDFGTSTSVVCYKDYPAPGGAADATEVDPDVKLLMFDQQQQRTVPTVAWQGPDGQFEYGWEAEHRAETLDGQIVRNFKMDLASDDVSARKRARSLLVGFLRHLHQEYRSQADYPSGETAESTLISYPACSHQDLRRTMVEAAREAGWPNPTDDTLDEPNACIKWLMCVETEQTRELDRRRIRKAGSPLVVMVLDMGAGTTDITICRYVPGAEGHNRVLSTWPPPQRWDDPGKSQWFGGREVDERLCQHLAQLIERHWQGNPPFPRDRMLGWVADWKVRHLSKGLRADATVTHLPSPLQQAFAFTGKPPPPLRIDRRTFGQILEGYLPTLPRMIHDAVAEATRSGQITGPEAIDLAILAGGHSQWYFVKDILAGHWVPGLPGEPKEGSGVRLPKLQDPGEQCADGYSCRILATPFPHETVARGLALKRHPLCFRTALSYNLWLSLGWKWDAAASDYDWTDPIPIARASELLPITGRKISTVLKMRRRTFGDLFFACKLIIGQSVSTAVYGEIQPLKAVTSGGTMIGEMLGELILLPLRVVLTPLSPESAWSDPGVGETLSVEAECTVAENQHVTLHGRVPYGGQVTSFGFSTLQL